MYFSCAILTSISNPINMLSYALSECKLQRNIYCCREMVIVMIIRGVSLSIHQRTRWGGVQWLDTCSSMDNLYF